LAYFRNFSKKSSKHPVVEIIRTSAVEEVEIIQGSEEVATKLTIKMEIILEWAVAMVVLVEEVDLKIRAELRLKHHKHTQTVHLLILNNRMEVRSMKIAVL
jgi:hypothetical protein